MTDSFNNNVTALSVETPVTFLNACLFIVNSGGSRGGARGARPPLFFDQNETRRSEKNFLETAPPPLSQDLDDRPPPPLSEGLDPPLVKEKHAT